MLVVPPLPRDGVSEGDASKKRAGENLDDEPTAKQPRLATTESLTLVEDRNTIKQAELTHAEDSTKLPLLESTKISELSPSGPGLDICCLCNGRYFLDQAFLLPCEHRYHDQCMAEAVLTISLDPDSNARCCPASGCLERIERVHLEGSVDYLQCLNASLLNLFSGSSSANDDLHSPTTEEQSRDNDAVDSVAAAEQGEQSLPRNTSPASSAVPAAATGGKKLSKTVPRTIGVSTRSKKRQHRVQSEDDEETAEDREAAIREACPAMEAEEMKALVKTFDFVHENFGMTLFDIAYCLPEGQVKNYKQQGEMLGTAMKMVDRIAVDEVIQNLVVLRCSYVAKIGVLMQRDQTIRATEDFGSTLNKAIAVLVAENADDATSNFRKLYARVKFYEHMTQREKEIKRAKSKVDVWDEIIQQHRTITGTTNRPMDKLAKDESRATWQRRRRVGERVAYITKEFGMGAIFLLSKTASPTSITGWRSGGEKVLFEMLTARESNRKGCFKKCSKACEDTMSMVLTDTPAENMIPVLDKLLLTLFAAMRPKEEGVTWDDIKQEFPLSLVRWPEDVTLTSTQLKPQLADFSCFLADGPTTTPRAVQLAIQAKLERSGRSTYKMAVHPVKVNLSKRDEAPAEFKGLPNLPLKNMEQALVPLWYGADTSSARWWLLHIKKSGAKFTLWDWHGRQDLTDRVQKGLVAHWERSKYEHGQYFSETRQALHKCNHKNAEELENCSILAARYGRFCAVHREPQYDSEWPDFTNYRDYLFKAVWRQVIEQMGGRYKSLDDESQLTEGTDVESYLSTDTDGAGGDDEDDNGEDE